ncbi:MAG: hypothetical protein ACP6IU_03960 [Candidatus Asgardarchaeia archaeon]
MQLCSIRLLEVAGGVGFIISAIIDLTFALRCFNIYLVSVYPISILLRAIAWYALGEHLKSYFLKMTGIAITVMGFSMVAFFTVASRQILYFLDPLILIPLAIWAAYSVFELRNYWNLTRFRLAFGYAKISFAGLIMVCAAAILFLYFEPTGYSNFALILWSLGFLTLAIASCFATYGFLKYQSAYHS